MHVPFNDKNVGIILIKGMRIDYGVNDEDESNRCSLEKLFNVSKCQVRKNMIMQERIHGKKINAA